MATTDERVRESDERLNLALNMDARVEVSFIRGHKNTVDVIYEGVEHFINNRYIFATAGHLKVGDRFNVRQKHLIKKSC